MRRGRHGSAAIFGPGPAGDGALAAGHLFTSPVVLIDTQFPVQFMMRLGANANAAGSGSSASADFTHTMAFPVGIDVFNLPAGYTVNAPALNLVNNRFVVPTAVPEPASVALMPLGVSVGAWRRFRAKQTAIDRTLSHCR